VQQHPIPHNILDFEFKLFSKLTVREFIYVAIGMGIAFVMIYNMSDGTIPGLIAIPIAVISGGLGLFFGLVPINDQKADVYFKNFIVAITNPTMRVWKSKYYKSDNLLRSGAKDPRSAEQLNVTRGSLNRTLSQDGEKKKSTIVGTTTDSQKVVESSAEKEYTKEELDKLKKIEAIATQTGSQAPKVPSSAGGQAENLSHKKESFFENLKGAVSSVLQPRTKQNADKSFDSTGTVAPTKATQTRQTISTSPLKGSSKEGFRFTIGPNNIERFDTKMVNKGFMSDSINLKVTGTQKEPLVKAIATIRGDDGRVIEAKVSDQNGEIVSNRKYAPGIYTITIEHGEYSFPKITYILDQQKNAPIELRAVNKLRINN